MMFSDEFMIAVGSLIKLILALAGMPVIIWILLYRAIKGKSNMWLIKWVFD